MSVRDEIVDAAREHLSIDALTACGLSGALLPIVERVAKYAAVAGINEGARSRAIDVDSIDAIVSRVMEGGQ